MAAAEEVFRSSICMKKLMKKFLTVLLVIGGNVLYAATVRLFLMEAGLVTGGTTGIALAVNRIMGIPVSAFVFLFNVAMLLLGWLVLGRKFAMTTLISTFTYPAALAFFENMLPNVHLTDNVWLCTVYSGLGIGLALGIVIRAGASTGGMDIPPLVLNRFWKIPVSVSMYTFDVLILLMQALYFPPEKLLYGVILVIIYTMVLDKFLLMGNTRTEVKIISKKREEIREAILNKMDRGVTMLDAEGGFQGEQTQMILSIISNRELVKLEKCVREIDPCSFMIVSRVSEVMGRGFSMKKSYMKKEQS